MSGVRLILVPYHAGEPEVRVGKGPGRLMADGLEDALQGAGLETSIVTIPSVAAFEGEIGRSFELMRRVAGAVGSAVVEGLFPLVLAGNCNTSIGVFAGLRDPDAGAIWFDAHADFDTPDEHGSGYFDGMGVATLAGQCWRRLATTIPDFQPIDLRRLVYCGIRDFEPGQAEKVAAAAIAAAKGSVHRPTDYPGALEGLSIGFDRALIHLDLDCLDLSVGRANEYAASGGLDREQLDRCLAGVCRRVRPIAMTIASFNPGYERADAISAAGIAAAVKVAAAAQAWN